MSTIVMESFDTQMFDSGDADVSMYTGNSAENWPPVEANMADDGIDSYTGQHDVEVEMSENDGYIEEYEMDDGEGYRDEELLDVDLIDASRLPSPHPPAVEESHPAPAVTLTGSELPFSSTMPSTPALPEAEQVPREATPPAGLDSVAVSDATPDLTETALDVPEDPHPPSSSSADFHHELPDGAIGQVAYMNASGGSLPGEYGEQLLGPFSLAFSSDQIHGAVPQASHYDEVNGDEAASQDIPPAVAEATLTAIQPIAQPEQDEPTVNPSEVESVDHDDFESHELASEYHDADTAGQGEVGSGDPHEISEGVYIDPPPAVLLFIHSSSGDVEYSLFNQPEQGSSSESEVEPKELLLRQRPTLYYEPLSTVFDALRHEERDLGLIDLDGGELVLDAYDLQLVLSEDNVHAHEVTLHDLNVLHDGADLSGPLRLELRVVSPRFITRYQNLRDQIARLDLADHEETNHGEQELAHGEEEDLLQSAPQVQSEEQDPEAEAIVDNREPDPQPTEEVNQEDEQGEDSKPTGEISLIDRPDEDEVRQGPETDRHGEQPATADGEESVEQEGEPSLDADDMLQYADADEGGDYTEFAEYVEDDEQEFGEELSEELGGDPHADEQASAEFGDTTGSYGDGGDDDLLHDTPFLTTDGFENLQPTEIYDGQFDDTTAGEIPLTDIPGVEQDSNDNIEEKSTKNLQEYAEESTELGTVAAESTTGAHHSSSGEYPPSSSSTTLYSHDHPAAVITQSDLAASPDDDDDWLESPDSAIQGGKEGDDAFSREPSSIFSTKSSKRGRDELEFDEDETELLEDVPPDSPDSKRLRVQ